LIPRILPKIALPLLLLCASSFAQTTYTSTKALVNVGEPERVAFDFIVPINGVDTTTQLIIQCDYYRAWLITNFDVYGKEQSSNVFPISCTATGVKAYVLDSTPLTEYLTMTDGSSLTLTVNSAAWQLVPCRTSRWGCPAGSAQITY
jgi:hypothetical protein